MEQTLGKSLALRESAMELFIEQKVDHENRPQISCAYQSDVSLVCGKILRYK